MDLDLKEMQIKATENGFELKPFTGYVLIEVNSGVDLYFKCLDSVNNYIGFCDLSEHELRQHYGLTKDSEI